MVRTLKDAAPNEFAYGGEFNNTRAFKLRDVEVVSEHDAFVSRWPGKEKHVYVWFTLATGHLVGWNENPGRGWSFPVIAPKKK